MGHGTKISNEYAQQLPWYEDCPKAVLAAIAVSFATTGGDYIDDASHLVAREWQALHAAGIVSQEPCKRAKDAMNANPEKL